MLDATAAPAIPATAPTDPNAAKCAAGIRRVLSAITGRSVLATMLDELMSRFAAVINFSCGTDEMREKPSLI